MYVSVKYYDVYLYSLLFVSDSNSPMWDSALLSQKYFLLITVKPCSDECSFTAHVFFWRTIQDTIRGPLVKHCHFDHSKL